MVQPFVTQKRQDTLKTGLQKNVLNAPQRTLTTVDDLKMDSSTQLEFFNHLLNKNDQLFDNMQKSIILEYKQSKVGEQQNALYNFIKFYKISLQFYKIVLNFIDFL